VSQEEVYRYLLRHGPATALDIEPDSGRRGKVYRALQRMVKYREVVVLREPMYGPEGRLPTLYGIRGVHG
jgi:sugar-specific transcriptional regulator TrmB